MPTIPELLETAIRVHEEGKIEHARQLYEQILRRDPRHARALNLRGVVSWQAGQPGAALKYLRQSVEQDGAQADAFINLAEVHRALNQMPEAITAYERAAMLVPQAAGVHINLGTLYQLVGRFADASNSYRRAVELEPTSPEAHFNLATALQQQGQLHPASLEYEKTVELKPDHVRAWFNLGGIRRMEGKLPVAQNCYERALELQNDFAPTHYNLANIQQLQGRLPEAIAGYRRALELRPDDPDGLCNLGNALREVSEHEEALNCLQRSVQLRPDFGGAMSNLGVVLHEVSRLEDARQAFERAIELEPKQIEFHQNLGTLLKDQGRLDDALARYEVALAMQPGYPQSICARGMIRISQGHFVQGWQDYELRNRCPQFDTKSFPQPRWDGAPLAGRRLLVHCEQGLGDTIQFIRYVRQIDPDGGRVLIAAQGRLLTLLIQSGFSDVVPRELQLPEFDVHVPLMSLPHVFGTKVETVPAEVPYLSADLATTDAWRQEIGTREGLKVGFGWQGRPTFRGDSRRSIPLAEFEPLFSVAGVRWLSLQQGAGHEQLAEVQARHAIEDLGPRLDQGSGAFLDTAAVMKNLDLVITSDTAIAHLAGALGVPVWVALGFAPDWRWMTQRDTSPWYPTMRLFRQPALGQWKPVFEQIAAALATRARQS